MNMLGIRISKKRESSSDLRAFFIASLRMRMRKKKGAARGSTLRFLFLFFQTMVVHPKKKRCHCVLISLWGLKVTTCRVSAEFPHSCCYCAACLRSFRSFMECLLLCKPCLRIMPSFWAVMGQVMKNSGKWRWSNMTEFVRTSSGKWMKFYGFLFLLNVAAIFWWFVKDQGMEGPVINPWPSRQEKIRWSFQDHGLCVIMKFRTSLSRK